MMEIWGYEENGVVKDRRRLISLEMNGKGWVDLSSTLAEGVGHRVGWPLPLFFWQFFFSLRVKVEYHKHSRRKMGRNIYLMTTQNAVNYLIKLKLQRAI